MKSVGSETDGEGDGEVDELPVGLGELLELPLGLGELLELPLGLGGLLPPPVTVIDGRGWTFVQIDTIVYTDDTPQTLTTTVGGTPVELRATPVEWRWDFGDKTKPVTTTKPGGPYPDKTVTHVYTRLDTYQVTLTTTWQGQWRLVGETTWRDEPPRVS